MWCVFYDRLNLGANVVFTMGYLIKRTPSSLSGDKTPYELLHGKLLPYSHLRTFGCLAYVPDHNLPKDKLRERSRQCVSLGCLFGKKGWRLYDYQATKFIISWDVVFVETLSLMHQFWMKVFTKVQPPIFIW